MAEDAVTLTPLTLSLPNAQRIWDVTACGQSIRLLTTDGFWEVNTQQPTLVQRLRADGPLLWFQRHSSTAGMLGWPETQPGQPSCCLQWGAHDAPVRIAHSLGSEPFFDGILNPDGTGVVWESNSGRLARVSQTQVSEYNPFDDFVNSAAVTDQGVLLCSAKGSIHLLNAQDQTLSRVYCSPPIHWLGACAAASCVYFWSAGLIMPYVVGQNMDGVEDRFIFLDAGPIDDMAYLPQHDLVLTWDGNMFASVSPEGLTPMYRASTPLWNVVELAEGTVVSWGRNVVEAWNPRTGALRWGWTCSGDICDVFVSPRGVVVLCDAHPAVLLLDARDGRILAQTDLDTRPLRGGVINARLFFVYAEHDVHLFTLAG